MHDVPGRAFTTAFPVELLIVLGVPVARVLGLPVSWLEFGRSLVLSRPALPIVTSVSRIAERTKAGQSRWELEQHCTDENLE